MEFASDYKNTIEGWLLEKYPDLITEDTERYLKMIEVSYTGTNVDDRAAVTLMNTAAKRGLIKYYSFSIKKYVYHNQEGQKYECWEKLAGKYDGNVAGLNVCYVVDRQNNIGYCCIDVEEVKAALEKAKNEYKDIEATSSELYQKQKKLEEEQEKINRELMIVASQLTSKGYLSSNCSNRMRNYETLIDMETM